MSKPRPTATIIEPKPGRKLRVELKHKFGPATGAPAEGSYEFDDLGVFAEWLWSLGRVSVGGLRVDGVLVNLQLTTENGYD